MPSLSDIPDSAPTPMKPKVAPRSPPPGGSATRSARCFRHARTLDRSAGPAHHRIAPLPSCPFALRVGQTQVLPLPFPWLPSFHVTPSPTSLPPLVRWQDARPAGHLVAAEQTTDEPPQWPVGSGHLLLINLFAGGGQAEIILKFWKDNFDLILSPVPVIRGLRSVRVMLRFGVRDTFRHQEKSPI